MSVPTNLSKLSWADTLCLVPVVGNGIVGAATIGSNIVKAVADQAKLTFYAMQGLALAPQLVAAEKRVQHFVNHEDIKKLPFNTQSQLNAEAVRDSLIVKNAELNKKINVVKDKLLQHLEFIVIGLKRVAYGPIRSYKLMRENAVINGAQAKILALRQTGETLEEIVKAGKAATAAAAAAAQAAAETAAAEAEAAAQAAAAEAAKAVEAEAAAQAAAAKAAEVEAAAKAAEVEAAAQAAAAEKAAAAEAAAAENAAIRAAADALAAGPFLLAANEFIKQTQTVAWFALAAFLSMNNTATSPIEITIG